MRLNPANITDEVREDMFEAILLLTELFFVSDPIEKPDWLLLPDPEPLSSEERRTLKFVVEFLSEYDVPDPDFIEHLKGFLVRRPKAA